MLTALVFVCSLGTTPDIADCSRDNAIHVMHVPGTFASPVACFLHGQAYVAGISIGRNLAQDERVKVACMAQPTIVRPRRMKTNLSHTVD